MASDWYRSLCRAHGQDKIAVGAVPEMEHHSYWVSSPDDPEPTSAEHKAFYNGLDGIIRPFGKDKFPNAPRELTRPYIVGDFFGMWSEMLVMNARLFKGHAELLMELLTLIQAYLRKPENRRWRVGYFAGPDSLVVFPEAVVIRQRVFDLNQATEPLRAWLHDAILYDF
jgi:hypothetical protein